MFQHTAIHFPPFFDVYLYLTLILLTFIGELGIVDMFDEMGQTGQSDEERQEGLKKKMDLLTEKSKGKVEHLAKVLDQRCAKWLEGNMASFKREIEAEATKLAETPGGSALCELIGHIYSQVGTKGGFI